MLVMVLSARDKQKKDKLEPCPHGDYGIGTDNCDPYLHFIVKESVLER